MMHARTKRIYAIGVGLLGTLGLAGLAAALDEVKVSLDQVPEAVRATILRVAAGADITEIEQETEEGKTIYEAGFVTNGQEIEIEIAPDGTIVGREVEDEEDEEVKVGLDQIPGAAQAALLKLSGGAEFSELERETDDGVTTFEAAWTANGVEYEVAVLSDGTLLQTEVTIAVADAPAGVRAAIGQHFPAGVPVVVEKKLIVLYELEAKIDGQDKELLVFPTGKVLKDNDDNDDGDDDDDDDD